MAENKELSKITIHAHDEEEAHRLVSAVFQQEHNHSQTQEATKPNSSSKFMVAVKTIGYVLLVAGEWLLKMILFLLMTPIYLWCFIRNWIGSAVVILVGYFIIALAYYNFTGQNSLVSNGDTITATLFSETKGMILLIVITVFAALATFGEIRDGLD